MMLFLGWTLSQWAEVAAWHEHTFKVLPPPDLSGLVATRRAWMLQRLDEPGEQRLAGVDYAMNFAWAGYAFANAALLVPLMKFK